MDEAGEAFEDGWQQGYEKGRADGEVCLLAAADRVKECDLQLSRVLHEMAGSVSMCWEPRPVGVFASTEAAEYVAAAITELRAILRGTAIDRATGAST